MSLESDLEFLLGTKPDTTWGLLGTWDGRGRDWAYKRQLRVIFSPLHAFCEPPHQSSPCYLKISKSYGMKFLHYLQSLSVEGKRDLKV